MSKSECRQLLECIAVRLDPDTCAAIDLVAPARNRSAWVRGLIAAELMRQGRPVRPAPPAGPTRRAVRRLPRVEAAANLYGQARMLGGAVVQLSIDLREARATRLHERTEAVLADLRCVVARLGAAINATADP